MQSKLYSEEQQANIEIKFIGKAYVRKVYSTVRESVPRYVGYNLLRRLADHFGSNCLNELIDILKETPFDVVITHDERKRYAAICARLD